MITEVGYRSLQGMSMHPSDYNAQGPVDLEEQANAYEALFESVWGKPSFKGCLYGFGLPIQIWGGPSDAGYSIKGKPAQKIVVT